jgi:hypothetical protein
VGDIYFVNGTSWLRGRGQRAAIALLRDQALRGSSPGLPDRNIQDAFWQAKAEIERSWTAATRRVRKRKPTTAFGHVAVKLVRTGQCVVEVEPQDLFTTEQIKLAQIEGQQSSRWKTSEEHVQDECLSVAEQSFFVIRDLTHQHYHHEKSSDLLTTVTPWIDTKDEDWRRETQYGLMRMAIALRRADTAQSYREALGVVAYADAFQKHLCGWYSTPTGIAASSAVRFQYDFAALRASIEASLKVRELKDSNVRARLFFAFGTLVTAMTVIIPAYRGARPDVSGVWGASSQLAILQADFFAGALAVAVAYPVLSLFAAAALGLLIDYLFVGFAVKSSNYRKTRASISRALGGVMAFLRRHRVPDILNRLLVFIMLGGFLASLGAIMYFCFRILYGSLSY